MTAIKSLVYKEDASLLKVGDLVRVNGEPMEFYLSEPVSKGRGFREPNSAGFRNIFVSEFKVESGGIKPIRYFEWVDEEDNAQAIQATYRRKR